MVTDKVLKVGRFDFHQPAEFAGAKALAGIRVGDVATNLLVADLQDPADIWNREHRRALGVGGRRVGLAITSILPLAICRRILRGCTSRRSARWRTVSRRSRLFLAVVCASHANWVPGLGRLLGVRAPLPGSQMVAMGGCCN